MKKEEKSLIATMTCIFSGNRLNFNKELSSASTISIFYMICFAYILNKKQ